MSAEEHRQFALSVEAHLRRAFPALRCDVRPHTDTEQDIVLLIFEVRAVEPSLRVAYTLIGNEMDDASTVETLVAHVGTLLIQRVRSHMLSH